MIKGLVGVPKPPGLLINLGMCAHRASWNLIKHYEVLIQDKILVPFHLHVSS